MTLRWVAGCMVTRGLRDPRRADPAQHHLDIAFSSYFRRCSAQDPAPRPQLALPSSTVLWIALNFGSHYTARMRTIGDLIVLAFFFLLRVGEYTRSSDPRLTVPLRRQDIKLWRNKSLLSHTLPLQELEQADAVTIFLDNQKNGFRGATLHHTASGNTLCPVRCAARLVHQIAALPESTGLGTYVLPNGAVRQVTASEIRSAVQMGAVGDNLEAMGYDIARIGSHSLRSGGATHLKLCGYDETTIKKLGRWSSNTYLRYIQTMIGELSAGIATAMSRILRFHQVS